MSPYPGASRSMRRLRRPRVDQGTRLFSDADQRPVRSVLQNGVLLGSAEGAAMPHNGVEASSGGKAERAR